MKIKKSTLTSVVIIIILIFIISILMLNTNSNETEITSEFANCIADNSVLYIQKGCHACVIQEDLFGQHYSKLETIDCVFEQEACSVAGITATPTWIIQGKKYVGVQYLDKLSELTGCKL